MNDNVIDRIAVRYSMCAHLVGRTSKVNGALEVGLNCWSFEMDHFRAETGLPVGEGPILNEWVVIEGIRPSSFWKATLNHFKKLHSTKSPLTVCPSVIKLSEAAVGCVSIHDRDRNARKTSAQRARTQHRMAHRVQCPSAVIYHFVSNFIAKAYRRVIFVL